jgi:hypothetical protein
MAGAAPECYANLSTIWLYQSYGDLSMGFAAVAALFLLAPVVVPRIPKGPEVPVPRIVRVVVLVGALAGLAVYASMAIVLLFSFNPATVASFGPLILGSYYDAHWVNLNLVSGPYSLETIGQNAFIFLLASTLCIFVFRLREGVSTALEKAVTLLAAPAAMAYEIGLLLFGSFYMPVHATRFLALNPYTSAIVTNWFVLIVASSLTLLGAKRWVQRKARVLAHGWSPSQRL